MTLRQHAVIVIGGPTAGGKSALALAVAEKISGTIINADSLQIYDGLPILTAQPTAEEKAKAPHALYGALPPHAMASAARWRDMALAEIGKAHAAGRIPVIVGGTGLYINALLKGLSPMPEVSGDIRTRAAARQKELGNPAFHDELKKRDPVTAARLDPMNTQRNVRAWEVLEATGRPLAEWQSRPPVPPPAHLRFVTAVLSPPREELYRRCDARFDAMLKAGALEETRAFTRTDSPLARALGYAELSAHLRDEMSLDAAATATRQATRNYAKRQVTWFRHQWTPDIVLDRPDPGRILAAVGI
jgi:tRNA dimethylallyltransferase